MPDFKILQGDALSMLRTLESESIDCCVTSSPYWGLRSYGTEPQVWGGDAECQHEWGEQIPGSNRGGSGTPTDKNNRGESYGRNAERGAWCQLCGAWRGELGLEPTPELFVEHLVSIFREVRRVLKPQGTLWANIGDCFAAGGNGGHQKGEYFHGHTRRGGDFTGVPKKAPDGMKPKDLVGIPWMLAFALRADGWWLRMDNVWAKKNCMPESVTDRPTKSHEYVFLLSKSETYYYDHEAIMEPLTTAEGENYPARARVTGRGDQGFAAARGNDRGKSGGFPPSHRGSLFTKGKTAATKPNVGQGPRYDHDARNKRSVWFINTTPFAGAHFAVMPEELAETCVLAGTPVGGIVLDPFTGSGTVGVVALRHRRQFLGIELNPKYFRMAHRRIFRSAPLTMQQSEHMDEPYTDLPLFEEIVCDTPET